MFTGLFCTLGGWLADPWARLLTVSKHCLSKHALHLFLLLPWLLSVYLSGFCRYLYHLWIRHTQSLYRCQGRRCRRDAARVAHLYSHCPWIRNPGAISVLVMQPLGGRGWRTRRGVCSLVNVSTSSGMLSVHFPKKDV